MSISDIITPQWDLPFTFTGDSVREIEQGSDEDIQNCIWVILSYEPGQLICNPDFGVLESVFRKSGTNLDVIRQAITRWEDRADELIDRDPNWYKTMIDTITIRRNPGA